MNDILIDQITKEVAQNVPGAVDFGIMTACVIDGEFVCVTDYTISSEIYDQLKMSAIAIQHCIYCEHDNSITYPVKIEDDGLVTYRNNKGFDFL